MLNRSPIPSKQTTLHFIALVVSLCSFAYELAYAELLTVMYGGAVTQYGLTIGLFFSSLGVGSYLSRHLDDDRYANFFRAETYIALIAPIGALFIVWLNATSVLNGTPLFTEQVLARIPVVLVGILSGFELPMLLSMVEREHNDTTTVPETVGRAVSVVEAVLYRVATIFFHTSRESEEYDTYSTVLAMDYLGGLTGALVFVFYLYPQIGLIGSVVALALLNCLAALLFTLRFTDRAWNLSTPAGQNILSHERISVVLVCLLLTMSYVGAVAQNETVNDQVTEYYMENLIEQEYTQDTIDAEVVEQYTTPYQQVTYYDRTWKGDSDNLLFEGQTERCMRLGTAIQLCDSWVDSYHSGLVDVPLSMYANDTSTDALVLGGGDWIAADYLRAHNVSVDLVDLDSEFLERNKDDAFLEQYHNDSYEYQHLDVHYEDAFAYLQRTEAQYDVIILDLPGATSDDLLHLYSTEFYSLMANSLSPDGVVATWGYSEYTYKQHHEAYMNTVNEAGFQYSVRYWAYDDYNEDGQVRRGERFFLFAPNPNRPVPDPGAGSAYVQRHSEQYEGMDWTETPVYDGISPSSIFRPNHDLIIPESETNDNE